LEVWTPPALLSSSYYHSVFLGISAYQLDSHIALAISLVSAVDSGALVFSRCHARCTLSQSSCGYSGFPSPDSVHTVFFFSRCQDLCWVSYCPLTTSIPYVASQISCAASVEPMFVLFYRVVLSIVASVCAIIAAIPSLSMVVPPESLSGVCSTFLVVRAP